MNYLSDYSVLSSRNPDEVMEQLSSNYCGHRMVVHSRGEALSTLFNRMNLGAVTFNFLRYGANVEIHADAFEKFIMVEIPVSGCSLVKYGGQEVYSASNKAVVVSSSEKANSVWQEDTSRIMVQISMDRIQSYLTEVLGYGVGKPVEFDLEFDISSSIGRAFKDQILHIFGQISGNDYLQKNLLLREEMQRNIILMLLMGQKNNFSEHLTARAVPGEPGYIRRAQEFIKQHSREKVTISDIVKAAGVSNRALYAGYSRYVGMTPMAALKSYRLHSVRSALLSNDDSHSITRIACDHGFTHMGNFSKDYKSLFNEKLSETRRRDEKSYGVDLRSYK